MRYLRLLLLPGERVLFDGRIHPVLYIKGFALMLLPLAIHYYCPQIKAYTAFLNPYIHKLIRFFPPAQYSLEALSAALFLVGAYYVFKAFVTITFTELAITDRRVMAKVGVFTTTTVEMDRNRVAGVVVTQTVMGKMLNYGWVAIRGFAGDITGLPVIANPHGLQRQLNSPQGI